MNRDMFQTSKYHMEDTFKEKCHEFLKNEHLSVIHKPLAKMLVT